MSFKSLNTGPLYLICISISKLHNYLYATICNLSRQYLEKFHNWIWFHNYIKLWLVKDMKHNLLCRNIVYMVKTVYNSCNVNTCNDIAISWMFDLIMFQTALRINSNVKYHYTPNCCLSMCVIHGIVSIL